MAQARSSLNKWADRISRFGRQLIHVLGGRIVQAALMGLAVIVVGWLLFDNVARPMMETVELPVNVLPQNPALDVRQLGEINQARIERVQHRPRPFPEADRLFVIPPSPTPNAQ